MADKERDQKFRAERTKQLKRMRLETGAALADVKSLLAEGKKRIIEEIKAAPSEFQAWQLPKIQKSIEAGLNEIGQELGRRSVERLDAAHKIGVDLVDSPLEAGGLRIAAVLPEVDTKQLAAMKTFTLDRMKNVTAEIASKVKNHIGLVMIGAQTPGDAVGAVAAAVGSGRGRAITITRTEMGRAFSAATQARQEQAAEVLPGMKKQWRRSGKVFSRTAHDLADGQIVGVDEPFLVNGVALMYPRDPAGPPGETINCGCVQLPVMEDWDVKQPGRQPFRGEEQVKNPRKRDLARELNPSPDIKALEKLPISEARKQIAADLEREDFISFINRVGGAKDKRAIAVLSPRVKTALGSQSGIVRLSSYTVAKQRNHRQGQAFKATDYQRVQDMLDKGTVLEEGSDKIMAFRTVGKKKIWRAVLKTTEDKSEVFLLTLHRTDANRLRSLARRYKVIKKEGE